MELALKCVCHNALRSDKTDARSPGRDTIFTTSVTKRAVKLILLYVIQVLHYSLLRASGLTPKYQYLATIASRFPSAKATLLVRHLRRGNSAV